ncbi:MULTISPECIES: hypothetical protein [Aeromonas]|uniref:hypothetical protein n=1 Tax=Aeromonas TaxID=642 RepID=UPI001FB93DED|nr:hypothetical protein [Aeromonas caviae]
MNNTVRFLQVLTDSNLSWFSFSLGTNFPIMRETKTYWIINILGDIEKKVMKSTFRLAGCKDSPLFGVYEPQPLPPCDNDPIPVRRRGRPVTGKALSPAEKQARYRARQAEKTVTVTFNRAHMATLKTLLANAPESLGLPVDQLDSLAKCVFDAALK